MAPRGDLARIRVRRACEDRAMIRARNRPVATDAPPSGLNADPPWTTRARRSRTGPGHVDGGTVESVVLPAAAGGWIRRLWPVWSSHRRVIGIAFLSAVVAMAAQQTIPLLQRDAIDHYIFAGHAAGLWKVLTVMGVLFSV